eukprot:COSAG06_NODE_4547_length_4157_cov_2.064564_5_plen_149_part_01
MLEMILDHSTNILCVAQVQRRVDLENHTAQVWRSHTCRLWRTSSRMYIGAGLNRSRDNTRDSANRDLVVYRPFRICSRQHTSVHSHLCPPLSSVKLSFQTLPKATHTQRPSSTCMQATRQSTADDDMTSRVSVFSSRRRHTRWNLVTGV